MSEQESNSVEILPEKLYWVSSKNPPRNKANSYYFCTDNVN